MSITLDLNILPESRFAGSDHPELIGLHLAEPPRRAARGRGDDRLLLYLVTVGNAPIPPAKQDRVLSDLAKLFYSTPGSVTSGMRAVAQALNELMLDRNLRISKNGRQGFGLLIQMVVRNDLVYLATAGPIHTFLISGEGVQHIYFPEMEGKGLGQGRTPQISYKQFPIKVNDTLIMAAQPLPDWSESTLTGLHGQGPQSLARKLLNQNQDVNVVLVQARPGKGKFYVLRPRSEPPPDAQGKEDITTPVLVGTAVAAIPSEQIVGTEASETDGTDTITVTSEGHDDPITADSSTSAPADGKTREPARRPIPQPRIDLSPIWKFILALTLPILNLFRRFVGWLGRIFGRLLPEGIPSTVMAVIALAVPVIVVTVALVIYNQLGRTALYEELWLQAEIAAAEANQQTDVRLQRSSWENVLLLVSQLEDYRQMPETQALREQALHVLDKIDMVKRVDYQVAFQGHLPPEVDVLKVVVSDEDLYLLDGNSGNVIRAVNADQGFVVDDTFQCGPGSVGVSEAGKLIDIVPWPPGFSPDASVLALDDRGNVLYCVPGNPPTFDQLMVSSSQTWGKPVGLSIDMRNLYALDPSANAVWFYKGSNVQDEPSLFFDSQIPQLDNVSDFTANQGELYLLHADGQLTLCYMGTQGVSPTRCSETPYIDDRPGLTGMSLVTPSPFDQILFTPPPDPSLFLLEADNQAVYHFSLRNLVFNRQYLPQEPLSSRRTTAFFVDTVRRLVFLALGNEVYFGVIP